MNQGLPWDLLKRCRDCEKMKPKSAFYNNELNKDGKFTTCKECITKKYQRVTAGPKKGTTR